MDPPSGLVDPEGLPKAGAFWTHDPIVDLRGVDSTPDADRSSWPTSRLWVRAGRDFPDDVSFHACVQTYISDYGSGFALADLPGLARGGPSLDHCMWFHHPIRLDDWVLLDLWPLRASSARGTYMGTIHDRAGRLGSVIAQESLLRPHPEQLGPPAGKS